MTLADHARTIWDAGVAAVEPGKLVCEAFAGLPRLERLLIDSAPRILVVGCGKAGAAMAQACEAALAKQIDRVTGVVNVPEGATANLSRVRLHHARPQGSNHPTEAGVAGAAEMLSLMESAGPDDVAICLISGGGSALLPFPVEGITLADKQNVTKLLHACGATIGEMNAVRKHLSRIKGGRLAEAFRGKMLFSFIISDVIGDPLDVIASGPTAADAGTFADALNVIEKYQLAESVSPSVIKLLRRGQRGEIPETPKFVADNVHNLIVGSNAMALAAAVGKAESLGYRVTNLGSVLEGHTDLAAASIASLAMGLRNRNESLPACLIAGGETTVKLRPDSGKGGRNQQFVLVAIHLIGMDLMRGLCVLSGGTDGEDGPTDAAGAVATQETVRAIQSLGLSMTDSIARHDAYPLLDRVGALIKTGLTGTNVMDLVIVLVDKLTV